MKLLTYVLVPALAFGVTSGAAAAPQTSATAAKPAAAKPAPASTPQAASGVPAAPKPPKAAKAWRATKTPWGDPDLQGVRNDATSMPLQRHDARAGKDVLTTD